MNLIEPVSKKRSTAQKTSDKARADDRTLGDQIISEESLGESQRFLSTLISNLPGYVYRCHEENGKWYTQFASDGIYDLTGYNPKDFLKDGKMSYGLIVHTDDQRVLSNVVKEAIRQKKPYQITYRIHTADGKLKWVWEQGRGIYSKNGHLVATEGFITDITEKKLAEEEILKKNAELSTLNLIGNSINKLAEPSEILLLIYNMVGRLFDNNNLYIAMYDEKREEISFPIYTVKGKRITIKKRSFRNGLTEFIIKSKKPLLVNSNIEKQFTKLGIEQIGEKSKSLASVPILLGDKVIGVITLQDYNKEFAFDESQLELLTTIASQAATALGNSNLFATLQQELEEKKEAEKRIKASLQEKELLLQEIHHRVKNNLQIMSSLLRLQSSHFKDLSIQQVFKESENRIKAMAIIHNKLYTSSNYDKVDFTDYVRTLAQNLFLSFGADTERIRTKIEFDSIFLNIDTAIPCGLIINELLSNSLKYAFPGKKKGSILITMNSNGENMVLSVKDDGVGFKKNVDINNSKTLGLKLVYLLSHQMDGQIETSSSSKGTEFKIKFKELVYKKRT
jgi:PAS domain S-box-containing protein